MTEPIMINFDTVTVETRVPVVRDTLTVRSLETRATQEGKSPSAWTWEDLRNYVVAQIERVSGAFPRDPQKEAGIFKGFLTRWGTQAGPIAKLAFEQFDGMWKGAPIQVTRFCKNSDPYFAAQLAVRLQH